MNESKWISYTVLVGIASGPLSSTKAALPLNKNELNYLCYVTGAVATVATASAVSQYFNNRALKVKLDREIEAHKMSTQKLNQELGSSKLQTQKVNQELELVKSDQYKQKQEQEFISSLAYLAKRIQSDYSDELAFVKEKNEKLINSSKLLEHIMCIAQTKIQARSISSRAFIEAVKHDHAHVAQELENIKIKRAQWSHEANKPTYSIEAQALESTLYSLELFLASLVYSLDYYVSVLDLSIALTRNYEQKYATELKLQAQASNSTTYAADLDAHIRALYSAAHYQFPYLAYTEKVKTDLLTLQKLVEQVPSKAELLSLENTVPRGRSLVASLEILLEYIVTTPEYNKEKHIKPEFDREEARIKQELHEKQEHLASKLREDQARIDNEKRLTESKVQEQRARIEQEKRSTEIKLQEEKARLKALENKQAEIERERKALEVNNNKIMLELARIRDSATIQEALNKNNREWNYSYTNLQNQYNAAVTKQNKLSASLSTIHAEKAAEITRLNNELSQVKTEIKNHETKYHDLNRQYKVAQDNAQRAAQTLALLEGTNPPFNPEVVGGLGEYITKLKTYARAARNSLQ